MTRGCVSCGVTFEAKGPWMKRCWDCWRRGRDEELVARARAEGYLTGYRDGLRAAGIPTPDLLKRTVALAHPDRHPPDRAQEANQVTAALLDLLEQARRVA